MAKFLRFLLVLLYGLLALLGLVVSLGWLFYAATGWGRWLACAGLAATCLPAALYLYGTQSRQRRFWGRISAAFGGLFVAILVGMLLTTPSGDAGTDSPVSQHFTADTQFPRYTLSNIVPETEQINLGFLTTPLIDELFTYDRAFRVRKSTLAVYRDMDRDADFRALGSALGWTYADFLGLPYDVGQYYLYIPRNRPSGPLPVILFLHGSFGNFKTYTWVWSRLTEELGYVIIAPSFGFGDWSRPGGVAAAEKALAAAQAFVDLDEDRLYLAGLSNGGLGVSLLGNATPARFRGLIFISPVMVTDVVDAPAFQAAWGGRPVLILTGQDDERVPFAYVAERARNLAQGDVAVTDISYPGEDHFLFFSRRQEVLQDISEWLQQTQK